MESLPAELELMPKCSSLSREPRAARLACGDFTETLQVRPVASPVREGQACEREVQFGGHAGTTSSLELLPRFVKLPWTT